MSAPPLGEVVVRAKDVRRGLLPIFATTILISAFLLFSVQPLFSKMVLPQLGGSPVVWSFSLVFFQAAVLAGYAYAHVIATYMRPALALALHAFVLAIALAALPIAVPQDWAAAAGQADILALAAVYIWGVGLPVFAISATAPLLQSWFSRTGHHQAADPYFLYGASNIGSFAALALYPFAIEPLTALGWQVSNWSMLYAVLALLLLLCGMMSLTDDAPARRTEAPAAPLGWSERFKWMGLSAVPSGLLVAVTAHVATDVVSAPFVWVVPLALFLLTFVIVFRADPWISHARVLQVHALVVAPLIALLFFRAFEMAMVVLHLAAFFVAAMVCHGELARRRPEARRLTEFYLLMSLGGVIGGIFASLISPMIFSRIYEYPILLVAVFACRADFWEALRGSGKLTLLPAAAALAIIAFVAFGGQHVLTVNKLVEQSILPIAAGLALAAFVARHQRVLQTGIVAVGLCVMSLFGISATSVETVRSLFGVHMVLKDPEAKFHLLAHGTTLHGAQRWFDDAGRDVSTNPQPIAYYYRGGPYEHAISAVRAARGGSLGHVGIMGLGSGGLSCYQQAGEAWRFFEIDHEVTRIARDPRLFTFLKHCPADVVMGDGRIKIAEEPDQSYDLLIMDAFSSDSIPVHLLTAEALDVYRRKLKPGGVMLFHVSNRYMELGSVVAAIAQSRGEVARLNRRDAAPASRPAEPGVARVWPAAPQDRAIEPWIVLVAKNEKDFGAIATDARWYSLKDDELSAPWTDDYSNVLGAIYRFKTADGKIGVR